MALLDDLRMPVPDAELSRRKLLGAIGSGALVAAAVGTGAVTVRYLEPNVLFEPDTRFSAAKPEAIAVGGVLALPERKVYVVHGEQGFYALSATCTHLGCMTRYVPGAHGFACPCHGSRFALDGSVVAGPAPRPLPRLEISLERGMLVVDTGKPAKGRAALKVI